MTQVTATQLVRAGHRAGERVTGRGQGPSAALDTVAQVAVVAVAAARVTLVPPQALLRWLERRQPVLRGRARALPQRPQTLRHVLAWR